MMPWDFDPVASGDRERLFLGRWQMLAYLDGRWEVRCDNEVVASGPTGGRRAAWWGLIGANLFPAKVLP